MAQPSPNLVMPSFPKSWFAAGTILLALMSLGQLYADDPSASTGEPSTARAVNSDLDGQIDALIRRLGDPTFAARELASRQLEGIGIPAKAALVAAVNHRDAEIRLRARRILIHILEADLKRRIALFEDDPQLRHRHELPGWQRFQEVVGRGLVQRNLYLAAVRSEPILLEALEQDPTYAASAVKNRITTLYTSRTQNRVFNTSPSRRIALGSVVAVFLVATDPTLKFDEQTGMQIQRLMQMSEFQQKLQEGDESQSLRRLLGHWIRRTADSSLAAQGVSLGMRYNIKEGLVPAKAIIQRNERPTHLMQTALLAIGKLGDQSHIDLLHPLLKDDTLVNEAFARRSGGIRPQIRDVALAVMIHLSGQKPEAFGFEGIRTNSYSVFQANTMGFSNDEQRKQAHEKWQGWLANRNKQNSAAQATPPE